MIRVSDLNFSYADKCVLQQVSFNVDDGDLFAILGPNAAGKTTLIKLLTGILEMQGGNIIFDDMPLNGTNDYKIRSIDSKASILWVSAPLFHQLVDIDSSIFNSVRVLLAGGDVVKPEYTNRVFQNNPSITIINGYGPTENTTFSTT